MAGEKTESIATVRQTIVRLAVVFDGLAVRGQRDVLVVVEVDDILTVVSVDRDGLRLLNGGVALNLDGEFGNFGTILRGLLGGSCTGDRLAIPEVVHGISRSVRRIGPSADQCNVPGNRNRFTIDFVVTILPTVEGVGVAARVNGTLFGLLYPCRLAGNIILSILRRIYAVRCSFIKPILHLIGVNGGFRRGDRSESIVTVGESCRVVVGLILCRSGPVLTVDVGLDIEGHNQLIAAGGGSVSYDVFIVGIVKTADRDGLCSRVKCNAYIINRFWITPRLTIAVVLLLLNRHTGDRAVLVD